jgi:hypothetical protein
MQIPVDSDGRSQNQPSMSGENSKRGSGPPRGFGTKRPKVQILSPRPVPQVAALRECRALRGTSHLPAIATEASGDCLTRRRIRSTRAPSTRPIECVQMTRAETFGRPKEPKDPLLAQEFSTTYSSGSMSSPVTARAGQCSASIATHRAPRRDLRASWLCSRRSGIASRSSSDRRASLVSSGAASPPAGWRAADMWPRTRLYRRRYGAARSPTPSIPVRGGTASRPRQRRRSSPRGGST